MRMGRRLVLGGGGLLATGQTGRAAAYPDRPIRLVLGFAPGGGADLVARLVAPRLSEVLGQPVVIDNRPGAGGIVATEAVTHAAPDGYTLLWTTSSTATGAAYYRRLPYDALAELGFVSTVSYFDHVLASGPGFAPRDLGEAIAFGRARPGVLNIGSISVGNAQNLGAELLRSMMGVEAQIVTYRGTPELLNATAVGEVHIASEILPAVLGPLQAGRVRALAVAAPARFPGLPEVPTAEESGLPGYVVRSWNGVTVPAGTPAAVVARLNAAIGEALADAGLRGRLLELGASPAAGTPAGFREFFAAEVRRWAGVIAAAGIERP